MPGLPRFPREIPNNSNPKQIVAELDALLEKIDYRINQSLLIGGRKKLRMAPQPKTLIGGQLKQYQRQSLAWMCELAEHNLNGILADDMGLGKTIQTISYLCYLDEQKNIKGKHLIVVPKNVLNNWFRQIHKWSKNHQAVILPGTEAQRQQVLSSVVKKKKFDVLIATYQSVQSAENILSKFFWQTLIIDEAHAIKNDDTYLAYCLRRYRSKFTLLLTGTPLSNQLYELWSLLNFILPDIFVDSTFFSRIESCSNDQTIEEKQKTQFQIQISKKFQKMLNPFLMRRNKNQINLGLKQKIQITLFVSLTDLQLKMYRNYLKFRSVFGDTQHKIFNKPIQLRKICQHPYMFPGMQDPNLPTYGDHLIYNSGKMKLLDKLLVKLLKEKHKILIFSQFTSMLKILEDYLCYKQQQFCTITGQSSLNQRQMQIEKFNNSSKTNIFLISTRAGGIGLNLVAADIVIIYDIDWNPQMDRQAMDRAYRIGQKNTVRVFKFITMSTIEQRMFQIQKYKLLWDELVIQKGGLAKIHGATTGEDKFGKIDHDKIADSGIEQIFKLQENFDDKTIEQIIKYGQNKDKEKTKEIRQKLQKQFDKYQQKDDISDLYGVKSTSQPIQYEAEKVGFIQTKKTQEIVKSRSLVKFISPEPFHLFEDIQKAGTLLYQLQNQEEEEAKAQIKRELAKLGFYNWKKRQYSQFINANLEYKKTEYQKISEYLGTKKAQEVQSYSKRFYEFLDRGIKLKDGMKVLRKQEQLNLEGQLIELQQQLKQIPQSMIRVASKYHTNHQLNHQALQIFQTNSIRKKGVTYEQIAPIFCKLFPKIDKNLSNHTTLKKVRFVQKIISESQNNRTKEKDNYSQDKQFLDQQYEAIRKMMEKRKSSKKKEQQNQDENSIQTARTQIKYEIKPDDK